MPAAWGLGTDGLLSLLIGLWTFWPFWPFGSVRPCSLIRALSSLAMFTGLSIELKSPCAFLTSDIEVAASFEGIRQSINAMLPECLLNFGNRNRLNITERLRGRWGFFAAAHEADG